MSEKGTLRVVAAYADDLAATGCYVAGCHNVHSARRALGSRKSLFTDVGGRKLREGV